MRSNLLFLVLLLVAPTGAYSEPTVIGDEGLDISIDSYVVAKSVRFERAQLRDAPLAFKNPQYGEFPEGFDIFLPFKTPELKPGKVVSKRDDRFNGTRPVCVVGDDQLSYEWIDRVKGILVKTGAICFVVNVDDRRGIDKLIAALKPVPWQLLHAAPLLQSFGVDNYPVLVSKLGVEQ